MTFQSTQRTTEPRRASRLAARAGRLALALVTVIAVYGWAADGSALAGPRLKPTTTVEGNYVTLGDLFHDAGELAGVRVIEAPAPGGRIIISFAQIAAVARYAGLPWRGGEGITRVQVKRPGTLVPKSEVTNSIEDALADSGKVGQHMIRITGRHKRIHVPLGADTGVTVEQFDYDNRSGRFTADLYLPGGDPLANRFTVRGEVKDMIEVPVLVDRVAVGERITERDIDWIEIPVDRMGRGTITDSALLIGMTPKRVIRPGEPIRGHDVGRPVLVAKGDLVSMVLVKGSMTLTMTGRALESGSEGDLIRIVNNTSRETVEVIVVTARRVKVVSSHTLAMSE